jgi:hypothetical protein
LKRRSSWLAIAAVALGAIAGTSAGVALAGHQHYASYWTHGCGECTNSDGYTHPFLDSSDGAGRSSCVAWAEGDHGPIKCELATHNHVDHWGVEIFVSAHTESSQTGLAHHHHFHHDR